VRPLPRRRNTVRSFAASKGVAICRSGNGATDNSAIRGSRTGLQPCLRGLRRRGVANTVSPAALEPSVAPGGNFNLSVWSCNCRSLGGLPHQDPDITVKGAGGFQDSYFYTHIDSGDGSMTFWDPENGVTTPNSKYPRSELRE